MEQPSQRAIEYLLANPDTANFFDEKYGAGEAKKILSAKAQTATSYATMPASEVLGRGIAAFPASVGKQLSDIVGIITSPIQTYKSLAQLVGGGAIASLPKSAQDFLIGTVASDPEKMKQAISLAQSVGGEYADKYGTMEGFKKALATDPASVMADLATLLTGGAGLAKGAASIATKTAPRASGIATTAADVLAKTASYVDPLSLTAKTVSSAANVIPKTTTAALGTTTGVGTEAISQAYQAGKTGGETAAQFRQNLRGQADMTDVLDAAKANLEEVRKQRSAAYKAGMENIKGDKTIIDFAGIDKAVQNTFDQYTFKGQTKNKLAVEKINEAKAAIDNWKTLDPAEFHTPEGIDALKQQVGQILEDLTPMSPSDTAVKGIYNAIKNEITTQAPTYAKTMKAYSDSIDLIREIERSLSLNNKASADTAMRKLQSLMRNNVNTNYGQRLSLARELEAIGGRQMMPALAGQALSDLVPRGIQRATAPLNALGLFATGGLPATVTGAALSSPRVVGETAFAAGRAAGVPQRAVSGLLDLEARLPTEFQITPRAAAVGQQLPQIPLDYRTLNLLYQLRQREEENR